MRSQILLIVLFVLCWCGTVIADSLLCEPIYGEKEYTFGDVRIVKAVVETENPCYPEMLIDIYQGSELMARYRNVGFGHIAASEDNSIFVGVSNWGQPNTAIVLFNNRGGLLVELKHVHANLDYCKESISVYRVWYDEDNPDIGFEYDEDGNLSDIAINDCRGSRLSILDAIEGA